MAAGSRRVAKIAEKGMHAWLSGCVQTPNDRTWRADLWGRRILFWTAYAPYILSSRDPDYRAVVLKTLARGAQHLERVADKAPPGLARITAWGGIITAALGSARGRPACSAPSPPAFMTMAA
jgi:uncharacterized heparinase superfamily protein